MIKITDFGASIFFSNEIRKNPSELIENITEAIEVLRTEGVLNILVILDEADPKLKSITHMQIGDLLGEKLLSGSKVAVYSKSHIENVESLFTEVIIHGRGTPIKFFNSESEAIAWFSADSV